MYNNVFIVVIRVLLAIALLFPGSSSYALEDPGKNLKLVDRNPELGKKIDLNLEFTNSLGEKVKLASLFMEDKAVILVPGYYTCPRLCGLVFEGVAKAINSIKFTPGKDYKIVTVSFNHADNAKTAARKARKYLKKITKPIEKADWEFLTGTTENINQLMSALNFKYLKDDGEFVHGATTYVMTPQGAISQYFHGINISKFDLELALVSATAGKIGSFRDQVLLYCFRFDPSKGKYVWLIDRALKIGGILSILLLLGTVLVFARKKDS